jgi:hypothetical protein
MTHYRKKPVVIEAMQYPTLYESRSVREFLDWLGHNKVRYKYEEDLLIIETLEGDMRADPGDWIIKGIKGEFYPCKPDIFEATYEPV